MPATAFAAIATFEMVGFCENHQTVFPIEKLIIFLFILTPFHYAKIKERPGTSCQVSLYVIT